jgi:hypothetical protein
VAKWIDVIDDAKQEAIDMMRAMLTKMLADLGGEK